MDRTINDNQVANPNAVAAEGSWNRFLDTRGGKAAASIVAMLALASACSGTAEGEEASAVPTTIEAKEVTASTTVEKVAIPALEEGESLTDTERVDACKNLMPSYGFTQNIDLGTDAPADRILGLRLSLISTAYREREPRLLWCVYPMASTGYRGNRDQILAGNDVKFPTGWSSMEELSRDDPEHVTLRWTFQDLQGSVLEYTGEFSYVNGIYLTTKLDSSLTQNE